MRLYKKAATVLSNKNKSQLISMSISCIINCTSCILNKQEEQPGFYHTTYKESEEVIIPKSNKHHIFFVLEGSMSIKYSKGENLVCRESQMTILIDQNVRIRAISNLDIVVLEFNSAIQVCNNIAFKDLKPYLKNAKEDLMTLEMKNQMKDLILSVAKYLDNNITCMHMHTSKQTELFIVFRHYYSFEEICNFFYKLLNKDMGFPAMVEKNYIYAKNVKELAVLCGYGLSNFKRVFNKHFQTSPYRWMLQQSSKQIHKKLLDTNVPIKSIVSEFNFTSQSHLNIYCKRYLGATASQIREGKNQQ